jgi:hypothetical protein
MALLLLEVGSVDIVFYMLVELLVRPCFCNRRRALGNWTREHPATWIGIIVRSVAVDYLR